MTEKAGHRYRCPAMAVIRPVRHPDLSRGSGAALSRGAVQRQNRARIDFCYAHAAVGFASSIFSVPEFAFNLNIGTLVEVARPIREFIPADNSVPLGPRLVNTSRIRGPFPPERGCLFRCG